MSRRKVNRVRLTDLQRRIVAESQGWKCGNLQCILPHLPATFEIDHRLALINGGLNEWSNFTALCPTCHRNKSIYDLSPQTYELQTGKSKYFAPGPLTK